MIFGETVVVGRLACGAPPHRVLIIREGAVVIVAAARGKVGAQTCDEGRIDTRRRGFVPLAGGKAEDQ